MEITVPQIVSPVDIGLSKWATAKIDPAAIRIAAAIFMKILSVVSNDSTISEQLRAYNS